MAMRSATFHHEGIHPPKTHLKHEQSTATNSETQLSSNVAQSRRQQVHRHLIRVLLSNPDRIRKSTTQARLIVHAYGSTRQRGVLRSNGHEGPKGHEQFVHHHHGVRRFRRRLELNAELPLRGVCVEVTGAGPATGANVWEKLEVVDVCDVVGEGEDVASDPSRCWLGLLLLFMMVRMVELEGVKGDLVRSL